MFNDFKMFIIFHFANLNHDIPLTTIFFVDIHVLKYFSLMYFIMYLKSKHGDPWPDSMIISVPSLYAACISEQISATLFTIINNSLYITSFKAGRVLAHSIT